LVNGLVNIVEISLELVNSLVGLCLTTPTLSMLRQVHISISQAPVQLPSPHTGLRVKSFKEGAKQLSQLLKQSRDEPSMGMNRQ
jgi:hypothetical protein